MKVAIMTWFQYHNYGTALQVTALCRIVDKLGYEAYVINYENRGKPVFLNKTNIIKYMWSQGLQRIKDLPYHPYDTKERKMNFNAFLKNNLQFTDVCKHLADLEKLNHQYGAFICGSDQIWAPSAFNPHYFLDFVIDENKMLAYAPSVGLPRIEDENVRKRMASCLKRFKYLSTREKSGSLLVGELIGRRVKTVLDPTFLINKEEWLQLSSDFGNMFKPYLLVYMLGKNEAYWKIIYKIANKLKLDVKIIPVFFRDLKRKGCIKEVVGLEDFLSLMKHASYICTDSFHGLAFSLNFNKPFSVFERFKLHDEYNQNSRIYNILELVGAESRLIRNLNIDNIDEKIDFTIINNLLEKEKQSSLDFLKSSLGLISVNGINQLEKNNIIKDNMLCCGCGACKTVCPTGAIDIILNSEGFYQAFIDHNKCVSCGKCKTICPYFKYQTHVKIDKGMLYSYIDSDSNVLLNSSSGGLAYRIAKHELDKGRNIAGCMFDEKNHNAKHIIISPDKADEIKLLQGSKYIQSEFHSAISQFGSNMVVFGTPCQIAGTRGLYGNTDGILLVDLICHGIPSYHLYKKYLEYLVTEKGMKVNGRLKTIFRYKPKGWRDRYIYNEDPNQGFCESQRKDPYYLFFEHGFCYSKGCYECPWRSRSAADIRLGDYWHRKYSDNNSGISMAVVLTEKGKEIIEQIKSNKYGTLKEEPMEDYFNCQQINNNPRPVFWEELIDDLSSERTISMIAKDYITSFEKREKVCNMIRKLKGTIERK